MPILVSGTEKMENMVNSQQYFSHSGLDLCHNCEWNAPERYGMVHYCCCKNRNLTCFWLILARNSFSTATQYALLTIDPCEMNSYCVKWMIAKKTATFTMTFSYFNSLFFPFLFFFSFFKRILLFWWLLICLDLKLVYVSPPVMMPSISVVSNLK